MTYDRSDQISFPLLHDALNIANRTLSFSAARQAGGPIL
jgi:hypothetical protein